MQAISLPYDVDDAGHEVITTLRRVQSAAVRSAYANAPGRTEEELRDLLKARFAGSARDPGSVDAWLLHCATREGIRLRNQRPDGKLVFGGRQNLERRRKGLITAGDWRSLRLRPLVSIGDKSFAGNRHFRLSEDARTCTLRVYGHAVVLALPEMLGKRGELLRAVAMLAAAGEINVEFRLGHDRLSVIFDPADLRRRASRSSRTTTPSSPPRATSPAAARGARAGSRRRSDGPTSSVPSIPSGGRPSRPCPAAASASTSTRAGSG